MSELVGWTHREVTFLACLRPKFKSHASLTRSGQWPHFWNGAVSSTSTEGGSVGYMSSCMRQNPAQKGGGGSVDITVPAGFPSDPSLGARAGKSWEQLGLALLSWKMLTYWETHPGCLGNDRQTWSLFYRWRRTDFPPRSHTLTADREEKPSF